MSMPRPALESPTIGAVRVTHRAHPRSFTHSANAARRMISDVLLATQFKPRLSAERLPVTLPVALCLSSRHVR